MKKCGYTEILASYKTAAKPAAAEEEVKEPPKEIVTAQIAGIEVMDLEDAVKTLWKVQIYAESGMGCTGPIIRVSEANLAKAEEELKKAGILTRHSAIINPIQNQSEKFFRAGFPVWVDFYREK